MTRFTAICPVCHQQPIQLICTAGTDAGTTVGELRCGDCAMPSGADWAMLPVAADAFIAELRQYAETALWSSTDDDGEPLDREHDLDDLDPSAVDSMADDLADFMTSSLSFNVAARDYWTEQLGEGAIGHDFWLTRNRHGAGFWDRFTGGRGEAYGRQLTENSHPYGSSDLYIGDDGKLYVS